jgi:hypothetical protein
VTCRPHLSVAATQRRPGEWASSVDATRLHQRVGPLAWPSTRRSTSWPLGRSTGRSAWGNPLRCGPFHLGRPRSPRRDAVELHQGGRVSLGGRAFASGIAPRRATREPT